MKKKRKHHSNGDIELLKSMLPFVKDEQLAADIAALQTGGRTSRQSNSGDEPITVRWGKIAYRNGWLPQPHTIGGNRT